ncbi:inorganic diphosphatase [Streptomyces sp. NPDC004232]|uniref:inorganic diphosphatase n=1 Tax=Streptomyces sp. NPDC004232 TaxID=3154454 RepID=UPI001D48935C|nr:inorganic diphosphatase [Streptomyces sp. tea 10]
MPRIAIEVEATVGSTIKRDDGPDRLSSEGQPEARGAGGWPVGRGHVTDTLGDDGRLLEALVLMREPAVPGDVVPAWPVAVLHLAAEDRPVDEVLCVAEEPCFVDLVDMGDLPRWHAEPDVWAQAFARLSSGGEYRVTGCGPVREADELLSSAHHAYLQLTGCME